MSVTKQISVRIFQNLFYMTRDLKRPIRVLNASKDRTIPRDLGKIFNYINSFGMKKKKKHFHVAMGKLINAGICFH